MNSYRVGDRFVTYEDFSSRIFELLKTYKYAESEHLAVVLKARKDDVHKVIKEYLTVYIKNNKGISMKQVCKRFYVKTDFIEELIEEGALEFADANILEELKNEEKAYEAINQAAVQQIKSRETISSLTNAAKSIKPVQPAEPKKQGTTFHVYKKR